MDSRTPDPAATRRRPRSGRSLLWRLPLGAILLLAVALLAHRWLAERHWAAYCQAAVARGIIVDPLPPHAVAVPDAENFVGRGSPFAPRDSETTVTWLADFKDLPLWFPSSRTGERMTTEKAYAKNDSSESARAHPATAETPTPSSRETPRDAEGFLAVFEQRFGPEWPAILEAEGRSKTQFIPANALGKLQLSALVARKTAQLHCLRATAFLDLHRGDEALAEVSGGLRICRHLQAGEQPAIVSSMIQSAMLLLNTQAIWEGLVDRRWSDAQLIALSTALEPFHPLKEWPVLVEGERAWINALYDGLAEGSFAERTATFQAQAVQPAKVWAVVASTGLLRDSQVASNRTLDDARKMISSDERWHPEIEDTEYDISRMSPAQIYLHAFAAQNATSLDRSCRRVVSVEVTLRQARLAIALERYRLEHGELPERLEALVPKFIEALPQDPVNGGAMRYARLSAESFDLWCPDTTTHQLSDVLPDSSTIEGKPALAWHGLPPVASDPRATAAR